MMLGTVPTSVPQFILLGNWIIEGDFARKWKQLKSNKIFWLLSSVFLVHMVGLLWTNNLEAGWNDVRTKIPLMFLPMVFMSTRMPSKKEFYLVMLSFLLGCFCNTAWCYLYTFVLHKNETVRSASRFMSHIRLGLYLNMGIAVSIYFFVTQKKFILRLLCTVVVFYLLFSMYALGLASGFINFCILSFAVVCWLIYKLGFKMKIVLSLLLFAAVYFVVHYFLGIYKHQLILKESASNSEMKLSPSGRSYFHFEHPSQKENGYLVHINIQHDEIKNEWKKRCPDDSFSYQPPHNLSRYQILIRYMSSKGLNKDSAGIWALSEDDIKNIRANITNYNYGEWSYLHKRIYEMVNEFDEFSNHRHVEGHSLSMRLYFWSNALHVISQHFFTGVGTGDVQEAMTKSYLETKAPLSETWFKRPHNQFLTIAVALGIFGLMIFLFSIIYPFHRLKNFLSKLYWPFYVLAILSFFLEDTLETQAGLTFFAFFNSLLLAMAWQRKHAGEDLT